MAMPAHPLRWHIPRSRPPTGYAQVDDLRALGLQNAAHDVNGRVMTVEEGGRRHDPYRI